MVFIVNKFCHYLLGSCSIFYVDHHAFKYLLNKIDLVGRVLCWMLLLQEFDFEVVTCLGKSHVLVDHLYRLLIMDNEKEVMDGLLDAALFLVVS